MAQKTYNIYPSLLDRVQSYIDSDSLYEKFWGASDQPTKQLDQFRAEQRQAVLDMINRVPHPPIMAASCGTPSTVSNSDMVGSSWTRRRRHTLAA